MMKSSFYKPFRAKLHLAWVAIFLVPVLATAQSPQADTDFESDYRLAGGDVIQVMVYGEDDLTMRLSIPGNGRVDYAFVGEFMFSGKTVSEVRQEIHDRLLGDYLVEPRVAVTVDVHRDFFVYGEVAKPGGYPWQPGLTVRKAISLVGGLKERASGNKWFLVPEGASESERRKVKEDDLVQPGDTLTIEQSFF